MYSCFDSRHFCFLLRPLCAVSICPFSPWLTGRLTRKEVPILTAGITDPDIEERTRQTIICPDYTDRGVDCKSLTITGVEHVDRTDW